MGKKRILIADDEKAMGLLLAKALEPFDFEIDIVKNGFEAFNQINEKFYDLIITDYMMPKMDGLELTQRIRSINPSTPPILVVTGDGPIDDLLKSGAAACLNKPFNIVELQSTVKMLLERDE
jgi:DNA-binding response OmpR family regulator